MNTKAFMSILFLLSPGSSLPAPSPDPMLANLMGFLGAAPAVLQTVVTGGGGTGVATGGAVAGGGLLPGTALVTAPAVIAPAMMAMSSMLPGVALGIIKAIFIAQLTKNLKKPKKTPGYPPAPSYGYQHKAHGHGHGR